MKNSSLITLLLAYCLTGCGPTNQLPVPTRDRLPIDPYGGYITLKTRESGVFEGELIGVRNDTIIVLSDSVNKVPRSLVVTGRIVVHKPNNYRKTGIPLTALSGLVMVHAGTYGAGPLIIGLTGIAENLIGFLIAQDKENERTTYIDINREYKKAMKYARFPGGIPSSIDLDDLILKGVKRKNELTPR